ncbi:peptidoglycan DD-metalloendopeptidase family protein [Streptomyces sp. NPDC096205]|uniref:peptidoglycan DD-metalloendopeptidase family protein n=1 Tax=Streptomyces sp. NPDC096205 TaxID=3366081 RepID=UPI0038231C13
MPAKGKHRRPKAQRLTRSIAVAGTGGAALALPLLAATGANAATGQSVPEKAVSSAATVQKTAIKAAEKKAATPRTYSVKVGDYLSKIAQEQHVSGGWQKLYQDNREVVGSDPSLIHPGLKLSLGKKAAATQSSESAAKKSAAPQKSEAPKPATQSSETADSSKASEPAATQADTTAANGYTAPVSGATVGTGYRVAGSMWSSGYHTGADFVVPTGTSLKAVGAGTVVSAGWGGAYGNQVVVKLADGYYAQYAHLSALSVSAGQTVTAGQQVGLSGATGNVTGPHLHFEIRTTPDYGSDVDPVAYLRSHGVAIG